MSTRSSNPIQDPRQQSRRCQSSPLSDNRADCHILDYNRQHHQQQPILDNIDINTTVGTVHRRSTPYPPPYLARPSSHVSPSPSQSASSRSTSTPSMRHSHAAHNNDVT
eukprot:CAMPEP_0202707232 /NCGR_PEP_ID=MMETSP1385-20130828/19573_1 /ASSEMBLY_ACC=CAM_ASM_000861 /TAXON_ID=933848 /ORGANISM="Elphidium margaritaceum" /LENGTH=108 /DNA_ID=CAMNT_0049365895 /DNA_START=1 /DNA_END=324 /DNA_ORIENTATION=-